ncbi:hypothetical protein F3Y22_tig00110933pilonHSYRG00190 [Hibiscus syriacus]|uniref:Methyltransferase n=1 Tax=Hibiscus syriacus TaxID=106335 RepID=A0A6A2ZDN4_HIBSY|nr:hypothetical protein F3Y22_tig00110933pilonHSYRG00190 [Hibiscus syriacus]
MLKIYSMRTPNIGQHLYRRCIDGLAINLARIRNAMDMNAGYGGFAAALIEQPLWVMNVVPIDAPDTLSVIFERGLIGVYHDWCESFNTYPRKYDLLHSSFLFKNLKDRCNIIDVAVEIDRILRPGGYIWSKIIWTPLRSLIRYSVRFIGRQLFIKVNFLLARRVFGVPVTDRKHEQL